MIFFVKITNQSNEKNLFSQNLQHLSENNKSIKEELNKERAKAIKGFKTEVENMTYPDSDHVGEMLPGEKDILLEKLDSL